MSQHWNAGFFAVSILLFAVACHGFEPDTHEEMSEAAVAASEMDAFLKSTLPEYWEGVGKTIGPNGEPLMDLVGDGAHNEDSPVFRVLNHFHDPTQSWDRAGLLRFFDSSIWRQQEDDSRYLWGETREAYLNALLSTRPDPRHSGTGGGAVSGRAGRSTPLCFIAVVAGAVLLNLGANADEVRYLFWDGESEMGQIETVLGTQWVEVGDPVPGFGAVISIDESVVVLRHVLSEAERDALEEQGLLVHWADQIRLIRHDLRFQAIPFGP